MRFSISYHEIWVSNYWSQTNITHGIMDERQFDFYAQEIGKIIGNISNKTVCDYGGGNGELAIRMQKGDCSIDVAEFSDNFKKLIVEKGLNFVDARSLPLDYYDILVANNSLFYVHPEKLNSEIKRLLRSLKKGGVLWITDVPVIDKINILTSNHLMRIFYRLTGIYQVDLGGFFIKPKKLSRHFNAVRIDSWCAYRSHFRISNQII